MASSDWRGDRLLILCYHGISIADEHEWHPELFMRPDLLDSRFAYLRDNGYNVIPLGEALERLRRNSLPPKSVALTFDDGNADFYFRALPLLQKYRYPATVYLTTYYCFNNRPVFNLACRYMMWKHGGIAQPNHAFGWTEDQALDTPHGREQARRQLNTVSAGLTASAKDELAATLAAHLGIDYAAFKQSCILRVMTPEQVSTVSRNGIDIELHTHRHRSPEDPQKYVSEINENRNRIIDLTGRHPHHFCYPSGHYRHDMFRLLQQSGVVSATTCVPGIADANSDPLLLPRHVDTTLQSAAEFAAGVSGASHILRRRVRRRKKAAPSAPPIPQIRTM